MKLSVNKAKLTGLWARNCTTIQQVLILKFAFRPENVAGSFEKRAPGSYNLVWVFWVGLHRGLKNRFERN